MTGCNALLGLDPVENFPDGSSILDGQLCVDTGMPGVLDCADGVPRINFEENQNANSDCDDLLDS